MTRRLFLAALLVLMLAPVGAMADVLVLIHGWHSNAQTWVRHGVLPGLIQRGWADGGLYTMTPSGPHHFGPRANGKKVFVRVDLPSEAPIPVQSSLLVGLLGKISADHPGQKLILLGHSAGGVVARHAVVTHPELPVRAVITLASPNLGSDKADLAALASRTPPIEAMAPMMGADTINRSRDLYHDLQRERPGSFLFWLNRQPHPQSVQWISLVRRGGSLVRDFKPVPRYSQDLRNVLALGPRARSWLVPGDHELAPPDGPLIADVIERAVLASGTEAKKQ
ncbi:MAG: alpha/beta fold hydrolase [Gammaproteobacteria bacterium]|nr:MAG: alpha/beta fold hydrolase [Gammaproteobacteria bacterium]